MSAGKNRQTCHRHPTYHSYLCYPTCQSYPNHRLLLNAAVISAAARVDVRCAPRPSLGLPRFVGAVLACPATPGAGGGAETPGVWTR
jgi:hypothetical protein